MAAHAWIDDGFTARLVSLRHQGEGQALEFMRSFPAQAHDLAKEIAAFATSNDGTILIGVADDGAVLGVPGLDSVEGRDDLVRRVEGCAGAVRPGVTPSVRFAIDDQSVVLVIVVSRGVEPVYFCNGRPYLRHVTQSRPAEPDEVKEAHRRHFERHGTSVLQSPIAELLQELAGVLVGVLIHLDEATHRDVDPWLDAWLASIAASADRLRELALLDAAATEGLEEPLRRLADALLEVAKFEFTLDCGDEFEATVARAREYASKLLAERISSQSFSRESAMQAGDAVRKCAKQLRGLLPRAAADAARGELDDVQKEAAQIGGLLLRVAYYRVGNWSATDNERVLEVGRAIYRVETREVLDGDDVAEVLEAMNDAATRLDQFVADVRQPARSAAVA